MTRFLILAAGALVVAACSGGRDQPPAPVIYQGSQPGAQTGARPAPPSGAPSRAPAPATSSSEASAKPASAPQPVTAAAAPGQADGRGVTFYDGYQTITARQGDTVDSMARRVGIQGAELAAYNGLSTLYMPLTGDELVLPSQPGGYRNQVAAAPAPAPVTQPANTAPAPSSGSGWSPSLVTAAIEGGNQPRVEAAPQPETQPEPQAEPPSVPQPDPAAQSAALDNAAAADPQPLPRLDQTVAGPQATQQTEPELTAPATAPGPGPAPELTTPVPTPAQQITQAAPSEAQPVKFVRPINAPISRPFSKRAGPDRNDGVDFASAAGTPVIAADSGTVVLVSRSLGGLGTILLIRHQNEFLTVYGRIDDVAVNKGDRVERGQVIAKVADLKAPRTSALHFEVRRGPESVDPEGFI